MDQSGPTLQELIVHLYGILQKRTDGKFGAHSVDPLYAGLLTRVLAESRVASATAELAAAKSELAKLAGAPVAAKATEPSDPGIPTLAMWAGSQDLSMRAMKILEGGCKRDHALGNLFSAATPTIVDLLVATETEMLSVRGFGRKTLRELKDVLATQGLLFGMDREVAERICRERFATKESDPG